MIYCIRSMKKKTESNGRKIKNTNIIITDLLFNNITIV